MRGLAVISALCAQLASPAGAVSWICAEEIASGLKEDGSGWETARFKTSTYLVRPLLETEWLLDTPVPAGNAAYGVFEMGGEYPLTYCMEGLPENVKDGDHAVLDCHFMHVAFTLNTWLREFEMRIGSLYIFQRTGETDPGIRAPAVSVGKCSAIP